MFVSTHIILQTRVTPVLSFTDMDLPRKDPSHFITNVSLELCSQSLVLQIDEGEEDILFPSGVTFLLLFIAFM